MRHAALLLVALGCASAPSRPMPALPPPVDIGQLLPPAPPPLKIPNHATLYEDIRVRKGDCAGLPAGILMSPAAYAESINAMVERKRLRLELEAVTRLRADERVIAEQLEQAFRARIAQVEHDQRWRAWKGLAVLTAVGALVIATTWAARAAGP